MLNDYFQYFLTLHVLAVIVGMGTATVSDVLFFKFLKDFKISRKEQEVLHVLKDIVMGAIVLIIVSGLALFLSNPAMYGSSPMFLLKSTIVGIVFINGIALHMLIAPRMLDLDMHYTDQAHTRYRRLAFALGAVSVTSWYTSFLLAMLKTELSFTYTGGLLAYVVLLVVAICGSQIVGAWLVKQAAK